MEKWRYQRDPNGIADRCRARKKINATYYVRDERRDALPRSPVVIPAYALMGAAMMLVYAYAEIAERLSPEREWHRWFA